jgi:two-component system, NarL family, nitrate/nitrite response regulator NarL
MKIMIADDFKAIRSAVAGILSRHAGWEVCGEAENGPDAVQKAKDLHPDLVLLDISMPGMDGLRAARLIRESVPSTKILILSHHDPTQLLVDARRSGADGCIDKSRIAADLVPTIARLESQAPVPINGGPQNEFSRKN